jgi:hypothetical protein
MRWLFRKNHEVDGKVFNLGFSKTGTTSFEHAMEHLGYKTYHGHYELPHNNYLMALWVHRDYPEIRRMTRYWDAFADAPWGGTDLYLQLFEWHPGAKFVQTVREPQSWYESLTKMLCKFSNGNLESAIETFHANGRYGFAYFMEANFGIASLSGATQKIIDQYQRHNDDVAEFLTRKGAAFLRLDSAAGQGWEELCPFLGKPIPEIAYPHLNAAPPVAQA